MKNYLIVITLLILSCFHSLDAQDLKQQIEDEISQLQKLVKKAKKKDIDVSKELSTFRTAEIFSRYADWDENNYKKNVQLFSLVKKLNDKTPEENAQYLPQFEREQILLMIKNAQKELEAVLKGDHQRQTTPKIDWSNLDINNNTIQQNGNPVFIYDYVWKPTSTEFQEFYGAQDGIYLTTGYLNEDGSLKHFKLNEIKNKKSGTLGTVFMNHLNPPKWSIDKYTDFTVGGRRYTGYDIDNPGAKEIQRQLISVVAPLTKGKNYAKLGWLLTNEPHWFTMKDTWATGTVSNFTIQKFKTYLKELHQDISVLNKRWGTSFSSFDAVEVTIPMDGKLQGTSQWYDWMSFNQHRVTEWFTFLQDEIRSHDKDAHTHIKVMPNLWTENKRDHGIDMEALTDLTSIVGNDAGSHYSAMWGKEEDWVDHYAYSWREMCMSYDFYKSISPNKVIYNSETHYLSTVKFRELDLNLDYVNATHWMATVLGLNSSKAWFWPRKEDGSLKSYKEKGYAGSLAMQPAVVDQVTRTMMDLNANAKALTSIQNLRKPIRVFYSETSAINLEKHMDDVFSTYENLFFEGYSIGFVTENILKKQSQENWDVVVVQKTPFVKQSEKEALQKYLDNGGTVVIDKASLLKNEYGEKLSPLTKGNGEIIVVADLDEMKLKALAKVTSTHTLQVNDLKDQDKKGIFWRYVQDDENNNILTLINIGKEARDIEIKLTNSKKSTSVKNILTGEKLNNCITVQPLDVLFVEVKGASKK
ncbi:alpha-amylase family protein [Flammeovirga pacifica]|nr:alpha-amylase family protein [Flammeovirga pacifica]